MVPRKTIAIASVIIALLGVLFFIIVFQREPKPPEVVARVLVGDYLSATMHDVFSTTTAPRPFANNGGVVSRAYVSEKNYTATVVRWPDQVGNVLFFESPEENRIVNNASSIKDTVSFSPSGTYLAFSELNLPLGSTLYSESIADWNIVILSTETNQRVVVEPGFRPQVLSENPLILAYSTPDGVVVYHDVSKEKVVLLPERTIEYTHHAALVSPHGGHIAFFNPTTERFSIFKAEGEFPFDLNPIGEIPVSVEVASLSDDAFLGVVRDQETNQRTLWQFAFKDFIDPALPRTLLHTFTEDTPVYSIIP